MKTILYIHGFNSSGNGTKSENIRSHYNQFRVLTPTFKYKNFAATLKLLHSTFVTNKISLVVGSSLGGFFALYGSAKFHVPCVAINPTTEPSRTLRDFLGENRNFVTKERYILTEDDLAPYAQFEQDEFAHIEPADNTTRFLLSENDELLGDHRYLEQRFPSCHHFQYFPGMNHQFTAMRPIISAMDNLLGIPTK